MRLGGVENGVGGDILVPEASEITVAGGFSGSGRPVRRCFGPNPSLVDLQSHLVLLRRDVSFPEEEFEVSPQENGGISRSLGVSKRYRPDLAMDGRALPERALLAVVSYPNSARLLRAV